jgi:hypothetical protein
MALKDKKLHPNGIQWIRDCTMAYKGLATFIMAYKKLTLLKEMEKGPYVATLAERTMYLLFGPAINQVWRFVDVELLVNHGQWK